MRTRPADPLRHVLSPHVSGYARILRRTRNYVGSAQLLSHSVAICALTLNQRVPGSSPGALTIAIKDLDHFPS
jgi:hypothetical protein